MKERTELNIGSLPGRKQKCLSLTRYHAGGGATVEPLAYFRSEKAYADFKAVLKGRAIFLSTEENS